MHGAIYFHNSYIFLNLFLLHWPTRKTTEDEQSFQWQVKPSTFPCQNVENHNVVNNQCWWHLFSNVMFFFGRKPIKTYNPKYHQSQTNYQKTGVASPGAVVCLCDDTSKHSLIEVSKSPKTKQDRSCGLMRAEIFRIVPWDLLVQER